MSAIFRHDISDEVWLKLKPHLPGTKGNPGRRGDDTRLFLNAVLWKLRTGCPWRDIPPDYGNWNAVFQRFKTWRDRGVWARLLEVFGDDRDLEWLMIDASHIKAHPHAAGAKGGTRNSRAPRAA